MTRKEAEEVLSDVRAYLASRASLENEMIAGHPFIDICNAIKALKHEPKTGHWVEVMEGNAYRYKCTNCDELVVIANGFIYCPHCGAKME